ncbi:MAG: ATP-binding protein, partial [Thermoprotei archaeon]
MPLENVVEAYDLTKTFGNIKAVDGVSFRVRRGEIYGLLGPNGAGKTTTIRMIIGIITPDKGEAYIMGYNVHKEPVKARSFIGVVPEISNPYVDLTVWENLMLIGGIYCVPKEVRVRRAEKLLKMLGMYEDRNRKVKALSKGMRRRLLLAMALISDPDILFLDEPTSGLDVISARIIRSLLLKLKKRGKTIILTTHNIDEAGMLCDRVAVMNRGRIIAMGTPEELKIKFGKYTRILLCFNKEVDVELVKKHFDSYETIIQGRRLIIICKLRDIEEVLDQILRIVRTC